MKLTRIFVAIIVAVMVLSAFAGCGNKVVSKVHIQFIVTVDENGNELDEDKIIGETDVEVEGTISNPPTVLKAAQLALINGERSTSGRQSETPIYNNDTLVFKYISSSTPREDNKKYIDESENAD